jgi:hypothetical protein
MGKLSTTKQSDLLPDFQKFLLEKKLAPEKIVNTRMPENSGHGSMSFLPPLSLLTRAVEESEGTTSVTNPSEPNLKQL